MATSVDAQSRSLVLDLVMTILPACGGTVILLLLGYYLWRRLHGKTRKQGDVQVEASTQDAEDAAVLEAEPCAELALDSRPVARDGFVESMPRPSSMQDRVRALRLSPRAPRPNSLPHAELQSGRRMLSRVLSAKAAKKVAEARDRARYPTEPSNPGPDGEPATTDRSANGFDSAQPAVPIDALVLSTLQAPEHRLTVRSDGQVKITEAAEAVEADRALRSCRARASIKAAWAPRVAKTGPVGQHPEGLSGRGRLRARARPSTGSQGCARGAPQPHKRPEPYKRPTPCAGCHPAGDPQYACENATISARRSKTFNDLSIDLERPMRDAASKVTFSFVP